MPSISTATEEALVTSLSDAYDTLTAGVSSIGEVLAKIEDLMSEETMQDAADACLSDLLPLMESLRETANSAEAKVPDGYLPYPTYDQLLFSV